MVGHLEALKSYEERGIPTLPNTSPSCQLREVETARDSLVLQTVKDDVGAMVEKGNAELQAKRKIAMFTKALLKLRDYKKLLRDAHNIEQIEENEKRVEKGIHRLQLETFLDTAKKAEFKGQTRKALDQYYEALYFLRNDAIDDSLQAAQISELELKIKALGGDIK